MKVKEKNLFKLEIFSAGQAAKVCGFSRKIIEKCMNDGTIKSYRLPSSDHRRIYREDLIAFLQNQNFEVPLRKLTEEIGGNKAPKK